MNAEINKQYPEVATKKTDSLFGPPQKKYSVHALERVETGGVVTGTGQ